MADTKITGLLSPQVTTNPATDVLPIVNIADTLMASSGSTRKITVNQLLGAGGTATLASATISGDLTVRTNQLVVNSTGVGVGTTPSAWSGIGPAIQVEQASLLSEASNQLYLTANGYFAGGQWNYINNASADQYYQISGSHVWRSGTGGAGGTAIGWSTLMTLNSTGLGVGVSPSYRIHSVVTSGYAGAFKSSTGVAGGILCGNTVGDLIVGVDASGNGRLTADTSKYLGLGSNGINDRVILDSTGNVGISVTPSAWTTGNKAIQFANGGAISTATSTNFSIARNAAELAGGWTYSANGFSQLHNLESDGAYKWYTAPSGIAGNPISGANAFVQRMTLDASGNLLVGTTNTDPTLNRVDGVVVRGNAGILMRTPSGFSEFGLSVTSGIHVYFASDNGTARVYGGNISTNGSTTAYNTTSDYRLKESVQPLVGGLARVNALKPSVYKWKSDGLTGEGFLAHELAEIVPIAVTGEKDAVKKDGSIDAQGVDMSKLVPILVAAIQELTAEVNALKNA